MHVVEKCLELTAARGLAQLAQGLGFDLANALAGDGERAANLLQCVLRAVLQPKAHLQGDARARASGRSEGHPKAPAPRARAEIGGILAG